MSVFRDDLRKKDFWIGRSRIFNLTEELKSFIPPNIFQRVLSAEKFYVLSLKDTGSLTMASNLFDIH